MINAEFRFDIRDGKKIRQWRDTEKSDDSWKDIPSEEPARKRAPKRCLNTPDMFDGQLEAERKKRKR